MNKTDDHQPKKSFSTMGSVVNMHTQGLSSLVAPSAQVYLVFHEWDAKL